MISSTGNRLAIERRFLAALFLYPRAVDIERHHFLAAQHGILFECIREAYETFPWAAAVDGTYDDIALTVVLELLRGRAHEVSALIGRSTSDDADITQFTARYFVESILSQSVTSYALDDLCQQVHECPRCGR